MTIAWDEAAWVDVGDGIEITDTVDSETGQRVGILWRHACTGGRQSRVPAPFIGAEEALSEPGRWSVESASPLTLGGSLLCDECQRHGFIRAGRWIPA